MRTHRPADVALASIGGNRAERIHPVVLRIGPAVGPRCGLGPLLELGCFRILLAERGQLGRVWLAGGRVRPGCHVQCLETGRCGHHEERKAVHRGAPFLPVVAAQQQCHAAYACRTIGAMRVAAADRQTPEHRRAGLAEDACRRQPGGLAAGLEVPAHTHALGMCAAKARMRRPAGLDGVGHARGGQPVATDPAGGPGERNRQAAGNRGDPQQGRHADASMLWRWGRRWQGHGWLQGSVR